MTPLPLAPAAARTPGSGGREDRQLPGVDLDVALGGGRQLLAVGVELADGAGEIDGASPPGPHAAARSSHHLGHGPEAGGAGILAQPGCRSAVRRLSVRP